MYHLLTTIGAALRAALFARAHLVLENLQQVAILARKRPRPPLSRTDRAFWVVLRRLCSRWSKWLVIGSS